MLCFNDTKKISEELWNENCYLKSNRLWILIWCLYICILKIGDKPYCNFISWIKFIYLMKICIGIIAWLDQV